MTIYNMNAKWIFKQAAMQAKWMFIILMQAKWMFTILLGSLYYLLFDVFHFEYFS